MRVAETNGPDGTTGPDPDDALNRLSGTVHGPAVQARDIHGGVHVHEPAFSVPAPRQLPATAPLVNREDDLAALDDVRTRTTDAARVAVVSGPAGIGKSALALHWAHRVRSEYPDGQLFADLRGHAPGDPISPAHILGGFLRALGFRPDHMPADPGELAALYRSATADRRLLVILDDALSAAQIRPLLPATTDSLAVVTSRWRLTGLLARGARAIQLDRLDEDAAVRLVTLAIGDDRAAAEPEAARRLVRLCARFPLALSVAAARLAVRPGWRVAEMADALAHERRRLSALATEEDDMAVRGAIDLSYRALPPDAARVYRLLGLFPGTAFEDGLAASLADLPSAEARRLLDVLADANLLRDTTAGRYRFHDLIRLHAGEMAERDEPGAVRDEADQRMLGWYLATATAAGQQAARYRRDQRRDLVHAPDEPRTFADAGEGLDWLERELPTLLVLLRRALEDGRFTWGWQLVDAAWPLFLHRGHYAERLEFDRTGLAAARAAEDPEAEAKMHNRVGLALRDLGRTDEAAEHFHAALDIWRTLGNAYRVAGSMRRLAFIAADRERYDEAIRYFSEALEAYRSLAEPRPRKEALTLGDLGAALTRAGRAEGAVGHLEEGRRLLASAPDPYNQARLLIRLAQARLALDAAADAGALFAEALRTMRTIASPPGEAEALEGLGDVAGRLNRTDEAHRRYQEAAEILERIGSPKAARLRNRLGERPGGS
ncbi:MAG: tetratricopeptide repeat protein [Streptosporangiales bacterium]|nr:tetratricopeptide repeat protein [Streptosporangiales bacterium]